MLETVYNVVLNNIVIELMGSLKLYPEKLPEN